MIVRKNKIRDLTNLDVPDELKLENQERRVNAATFDRIDLVIDFQPGKDGIGAIVRKFTDGICNHDLVVKEIEQRMNLIDELKKNYRKKVRLFRNLDNTWNVIYTNPVEFQEYLELIPKMKNIEERLKKVEDIDVKSRLEAMYERYKFLHPKCSRQKIIYGLYQQARKEKEAVTKEYITAEKVLAQLQEQEKHLASLISDDHMLADEKNISLSELFPNVHVGYILTRINQYSTENMPFDEVMKCIMRAKSPHKIECKRYDYRYNIGDARWYSIEELRNSGVFVENPVLNKIHFISSAAKGDLSVVKQLIDEGEDPNCVDLTGNTAIVAAAVNKHIEMVELLYSKGANVNCRDKNYMTPLLYVINRGYLDLIRLLIAYGADKNAVDRNVHGCFYYAILSQSLQVVKMFFQISLKNAKEKLWGFTPLHLAANTGNLAVVEYLLTQRCSIYQLDFANKTPEEVARDAKHHHVAKRLYEERINGCGQCIFYDKEKQFQLWIGDHACLEMEWIIDLEINGIIYFHSDPILPLPYQWLLNQYSNKEKIEKLRAANEITETPAASAQGQGDKRKSTTPSAPSSRKGTAVSQSTALVPHDRKDVRTPEGGPRGGGGRSRSPTTNSLVPFSPEQKNKKSINNNNSLVVSNSNNHNNKNKHSSSVVDDDEDLSDIDEPKPTNNNSRRSTKKKTGFIRVAAVPTAESRRSSTRTNRDDEDDDEDDDDDDDEVFEEIAFHPFHVPMDAVDGDNHDNWEELQKYIIPMMDIIPIYHLHQHEDLLAKQSVYSSLQNSISAPNNDNNSHAGGRSIRSSLLSTLPSSMLSTNSNHQKTKQMVMKKFLIVCDTGNSLAPAMASIYLLLKSSVRIKEILEEMKLSRPSIEIKENIAKGLQEIQYKYDDKVLKRMNAKLRNSVVSSIAF